MLKSKVDKLSLDLIRDSLGIITLEEIEEKEQDESQRKEYCTAIAAVFPRLEKDIKKALYEQLIKMHLQSDVWEHTLVGRGVYAGMELLLTKWREANAEHLSQPKSKEGFDPHNPISEI